MPQVIFLRHFFRLGDRLQEFLKEISINYRMMAILKFLLKVCGFVALSIFFGELGERTRDFVLQSPFIRTETFFVIMMVLTVFLVTAILARGIDNRTAEQMPDPLMFRNRVIKETSLLTAGFLFMYLLMRQFQTDHLTLVFAVIGVMTPAYLSWYRMLLKRVRRENPFSFSNHRYGQP